MGNRCKGTTYTELATRCNTSATESDPQHDMDVYPILIRQKTGSSCDAIFENESDVQTATSKV